MVVDGEAVPVFGKGSSSYEVQSRRDGRWQIEGAFTDQEAALSCARSQLAGGGVEEVKVVKFRTLAGLSLETVILNKKVPVGVKKALVLGGSAEGAPFCRTLDDLYGFESRVVIGRLLRPFLDAQRLTPTELLHSWPAYRKLEEQGALLGAAVHAVARHHGDLHGIAVPDRVRVLRGLVVSASSRARDFLAERKRLPGFDDRDLDATSRRIDAVVGEGGHDTLFLSLLTLHLAEGGTLPGKLEQLLVLMHNAEPRHLALFDGVAADVVGSADTLKELLGEQPSLAMGLCALADALHGRDPEPGGLLGAPPSSALTRLCDLAIRERAPLSRIVLIDRLRQALAGDQPLDRRDPKTEGALLRTITERLTGADGRLLGGAAMSKALDRRMLRHRQTVLRDQGMHDIADRLSMR
ncbi:hypothetical protein MCW82_26880 [Azospirillum doebereinerae]|uniref:hypothetical protein n=1 Tax=Azospirillum doebereinerae TaxID=92933 RepID=UPI001EE5FFA7|nr:hypothetical protein [Azospirillum doebereinerae]MCG5243410.1 hypothetical protein [Azospirillum doebereinerae]